MRVPTTINNDMDLLTEVQRELGTATATETIHRALHEVIQLRSRQRLMQLDLSTLSTEDLERIRQDRKA